MFVKAHRFGSGRGIIACASIVPRHPEAFARPARKSGNAGRSSVADLHPLSSKLFSTPPEHATTKSDAPELRFLLGNSSRSWRPSPVPSFHPGGNLSAL